MSAPTKRADRTEISRAIPLLCKPGAVYELRALGTRKGTVSGYFDNVDKLIEAALIADKLDAIGTYISINPVKRDVLARAANTHRVYAKTTTSDPEIERRLWLPI